MRIITTMSFLLAFMTAATAQVSGQAFEGFRGSSKEPISIEADNLEVLDGEARAIFEGNVNVRQGGSLIVTGRLVVHYLKGGGGGQNDIERLDLSGGLVVTSDDNTISAEEGTYMVTTEDITLTGDVVVSQGESIAKGCTLIANMKTNRARLQACPGQKGRVRSVFKPGSN